MARRLHRWPGWLPALVGALPGIGLALLSTAQANGTDLGRVALGVTVAGVVAGAVYGSLRQPTPP